MSVTIPFNKPCIVGAELIYVGQAVAGGHASGDGPFTKRVEKLMQTQFGAHAGSPDHVLHCGPRNGRPALRA